jgi:Aldehyde dehydrogenase family
VCGDPATIVDLFLAHDAVELVSFTGGVAVGKSIAARLGYRRAVLELGGNDGDPLDPATDVGTVIDEPAAALIERRIAGALHAGAELLCRGERDGALLPFWQLTSEQDWALCECNHAGVRSPAFTPAILAQARVQRAGVRGLVPRANHRGRPPTPAAVALLDG